MTISNQNLFDIAIEKSGSVLAAFDWALKNGKSITDSIDPGTFLITPETEYEDLSIKEYFFKRHIATDINLLESIIIDPEGGIGTMIIEDTFIIY